MPVREYSFFDVVLKVVPTILAFITFFILYQFVDFINKGENYIVAIVIATIVLFSFQALVKRKNDRDENRRKEKAQIVSFAAKRETAMKIIG